MDSSPRPKRRNASRTRLGILAAAQRSFSERGYAQAGLRDIAALADVSSTMVLRYFGSKAGLFEAALIDAMRVDELLKRGKQGVGEFLSTRFLNAGMDVTPPSMIALSTSDEEAREITCRVTEEYVVAPLAEWLGPPEARARALEIVLLSTGFVLYTRRLPELFAARGVDRQLAAWFARSVQAIVDRS
jgi:AcrR family transcriptional regulator